VPSHHVVAETLSLVLHPTKFILSKLLLSVRSSFHRTRAAVIRFATTGSDERCKTVTESRLQRSLRFDDFVIIVF